MRYNPQWHNQDRKKGIHLAAEVVRRNNQLESQSPGLKGDWTKWKGWKGTKGDRRAMCRAKESRIQAPGARMKSLIPYILSRPGGTNYWLLNSNFSHVLLVKGTIGGNL